MTISSTPGGLHCRVRQNRRSRYFAIFKPIVLAPGFLPSGFVKITGERVAVLKFEHPMSRYPGALHRTGYRDKLTGTWQVTADIALLIGCILPLINKGF